jgi:hypothetical protein
MIISEFYHFSMARSLLIFLIPVLSRGGLRYRYIGLFPNLTASDYSKHQGYPRQFISHIWKLALLFRCYPSIFPRLIFIGIIWGQQFFFKSIKKKIVGYITKIRSSYHFLIVSESTILSAIEDIISKPFSKYNQPHTVIRNHSNIPKNRLLRIYIIAPRGHRHENCIC